MPTTTTIDDQDRFWPAINADLETIHKLLESDDLLCDDPEVCFGCNMPFDKGKKRKLIDNCGHERCYSCLFTNEICPLCTNGHQLTFKSAEKNGKSSSNGYPDVIQEPINSLYGKIGKIYRGGSAGNLSSGTQTRTKVKTNGHFTSAMQARQSVEDEYNWQEVSPCRLPRPSPSPMSDPPPASSSTKDVPTSVQSSATPPQPRRKFFNSKGIKNGVFPFQRSNRQANGNNNISDDEGVSTMSPDGCSSSGGGGSKSAISEGLYTRLGLLLGDGARKNCPPRSRSATRKLDVNASVSSLASLDANNVPSNNTSPVSTLTTGSTDTDPHRANMDPSSESVGSLMSMSSQSRYSDSTSPVTRRHSVTTSQPGQIEELNIFKNRKNSIRRSARSGTVKGPIDPKVRFAQYRSHSNQPKKILPTPQPLSPLTSPVELLKPLYFEVAMQESDPLFIGREWMLNEIESVVNSTLPGVLITGLPGAGKTALILQLVDYSCFGRRKEPIYNTINDSSSSQYSIYCQVNLVPEHMRELASRVVAYHFCQVDNNVTCTLPDFVHSIAAQLNQAPQLADYHEYLANEADLQGALSMRECITDPDHAFAKGVLEPLSYLTEMPTCVILVDGLEEAEYHRPDHGDSIPAFLSKHSADFPPWLKVIATVRTHLDELMPILPYKKLSLDVNSQFAENVQKDILDYINLRVTNSPSIQNNLVTGATGQYKFGQHLLGLCKGSFLFAKLTLDLFERGSLVAKSTSFNVLPVTLSQIYMLHFNLRFPTTSSFQKVSNILSVALAALYPLNLSEIYHSVNALNVHSFITWDEFLSRFKLLSGLLIKRSDTTYMFFHPSLREWLIKRDDSENNKYQCDLRSGHAAIAFRLSRMEAPIDCDKVLELGHHLLKGHIFKNIATTKYSSCDLQSYLVTTVVGDVSEALCSIRNVYSPNIMISRLLLLSGACANQVTELLGCAPVLCIHAHENSLDMVALLLEFGADVDQANNQGCTPLIFSAIRGHIDVVKLLVNHSASLGKMDIAGRCALVHAARNGHLQVVAFLLSSDWLVVNADDEINSAEATQQALVAAASQGHLHIIEYLLDSTDVDMDARDTLSGETALTLATTNDCQEVCNALLARGCKVSVANRKDMSPLILAVQRGHWTICEWLLHYHASVDQSDSANRTPLMIAAGEGHQDILQLLLDGGAEVNAQDCEGMSALCHACLRGRVAIAEKLIDRGADINCANKMGRSPLDLASFHGNQDLVQLLVDRGAAIEHSDLRGVRPLDRAISCRNIPVVKFFLRRGAKLGPTTWTMAAGKPDLLLVLLNKLLDDGNTLYRKGRLKESAHRYSYALGRFPPVHELDAPFRQLRMNFLLNFSRCKRKMNDPAEAVKLATEVLKLRPESYEAHYARAKAHLDLQLKEEALSDIQEALVLVSPQNREMRHILLNMRDEIKGRPASSISVDVLHSPTETSL